MQIRIVAAGKLREPYVAQACEEFRKRLGPYFPLEVVEVKAAPGSNPAQAMHEEADRLGRALAPEDSVWLLDRCGEQIDSPESARRLSAVAHSGTRRLCIVVAGTHGAAPALHERADFVWSLSALTFLHEWARMIALEQIYRAAKIARNEPYHH